MKRFFGGKSIKIETGVEWNPHSVDFGQAVEWLQVLREIAFEILLQLDPKIGNSQSCITKMAVVISTYE